jgi:hypothetical protein
VERYSTRFPKWKRSRDVSAEFDGAECTAAIWEAQMIEKTIRLTILTQKIQGGVAIFSGTRLLVRQTGTLLRQGLARRSLDVRGG